VLLKASGANSDRGPQGPAGLTPEALARRGKAEFLPSFAALQEAVRRACAGEAEWEARVIAGCYAVLEFAAGDADAAGALTINARERASSQINPEREVIGYFARLLADSTPDPMLFPISSEESLVESVALIVRAHLQARTAERLPELAPDLAYLLLMPYKGLEEARSWVERATPIRSG
jgi:hypothetical protein